MIRLNEEFLSVQEGLYFHDGKLFSGIGFRVHDGIVVSSTIYEEGRGVREYVNDYLDTHMYALKVDYFELEAIGEGPYYYNGERFNGVAYLFEDDGSCSEERIYENGDGCSYVGYYNSGALEELYLYDHFSQLYCWSEEGELLELVIKEKVPEGWSSNVATFIFRSDRTVVYISKDYFTYIKGYKDIFVFPIYEEKSFADDKSCSEYLALAHEGVDDEVFNSISKNNGLKKVKRLILRGTSLTETSYEKISNLLLDECILEGGDDFLALGKKLKSKRPQCRVMCNNVLL